MIYWAVLLGVLSSLHCVGMCGPLVLLLPYNKNRPYLSYLNYLVYQIGRVTTYVCLGLLFGLFGKMLMLVHLHQTISFTIGLYLLFRFLSKKGIIHIPFMQRGYVVFSKIGDRLGWHKSNKKTYHFFIGGILNGLLPCGILYLALLSALSTYSFSDTVFYMMFFGFGTMPVMIVVFIFKNSLLQKIKIRNQLVWTDFALLLSALFLIIRALNLDLPMLSPSSWQLTLFQNPSCG